MDSRSVAFHHFGCKVNFAEASSISNLFREHGYMIKEHNEPADVYVISSCAVTAEAEKKCRAAVRHARKLNPGALIAVVGCLSELNIDDQPEMEGVDIVLGNKEKFRMLEEIEGRLKGEQKTNKRRTKDEQKTNETDFIPAFSSGDRTRSFLKIQDGCDYLCAYCAIPLARGKSRSDTIDHVLKEAHVIADRGAQEIVLTGINLGDFGRKKGESFYELLTRMEKEIPVPRIRISSVEPDLLSDDIIRLVSGSAKLLPHFHIPLQSGSNKILKAMQRRYNRELYAGRIALIRSLMPYACIAADVIAGYPGESEHDFGETVSFLESMAVSYLHVFSYSRRENTVAAGSTEMITGLEKKRRSAKLHQLSDQKKNEFYNLNLGKQATVLFESDNKEGYMHGFTENYIKVKTPFRNELINTIQPVKLENLNDEMEYLVICH